MNISLSAFIDYQLPAHPAVSVGPHSNHCRSKNWSIRLYILSLRSKRSGSQLQQFYEGPLPPNKDIHIKCTYYINQCTSVDQLQQFQYHKCWPDTEEKNIILTANDVIEVFIYVANRFQAQPRIPMTSPRTIIPSADIELVE